MIYIRGSYTSFHLFPVAYYLKLRPDLYRIYKVIYFIKELFNNMAHSTLFLKVQAYLKLL